MGNRKPITLENFRLFCISDEEMTDEEIRSCLGMVFPKSEEEISEVCNILHKYRPVLERKLIKQLNGKRCV